MFIKHIAMPIHHHFSSSASKRWSNNVQKLCLYMAKRVVYGDAGFALSKPCHAVNFLLLLHQPATLKCDTHGKYIKSQSKMRSTIWLRDKKQKYHESKYQWTSIYHRNDFVLSGTEADAVQRNIVCCVTRECRKKLPSLCSRHKSSSGLDLALSVWEFGALTAGNSKFWAFS